MLALSSKVPGAPPGWCPAPALPLCFQIHQTGGQETSPGWPLGAASDALRVSPDKCSLSVCASLPSKPASNVAAAKETGSLGWQPSAWGARACPAGRALGAGLRSSTVLCLADLQVRREALRALLSRALATRETAEKYESCIFP